MTKSNGTAAWKWVGIIVTILLAVATIVGGFLVSYGGHDEKVATMERDQAEMKPEVKANTEHRIKFEEKVTTMEKNVGTILTIVQELEKK